MSRHVIFAAAVVAAAACTSKQESPADTPPADSTINVPAISTAANPTDTGGMAPPPQQSKIGAAPDAPATTPTPGTKGGAPAQSAEPAIHPEDLNPVIATTLSQVDTTITMRAHGAELMFDPPTITLKQGTRVRIRFQNMGTFAHNFILVRSEDDIEELAARAVDARENVPMSLKSKMLAWTKIANPSQTVDAGFVVPPAGEYYYVCFVEGHANTMVGKLKSLP